MAGTAEEEPIEDLEYLTEDNREICFEQGKPCTYEDEDSPGQIVTEWPNGTIDRLDLETKTTIRCWPDGRCETLTGEPDLPRWPRAETADECRS